MLFALLALELAAGRRHADLRLGLLPIDSLVVIGGSCDEGMGTLCHGPFRNSSKMRASRGGGLAACLYRLQSGGVTGRQIGAPLDAAQSPPNNSTDSSCASSPVAARSDDEGQWANFPLESRLWQSQNPWPSYTRIFMAVLRRLRNTYARAAELVRR